MTDANVPRIRRGAQTQLGMEEEGGEGKRREGARTYLREESLEAERGGPMLERNGGGAKEIEAGGWWRARRGTD